MSDAATTPGTGLAIGDLARDEIAAAVALWTAAGLTRPWNDPNADIDLALASPGSTVLAGRRDGRLVATAMVGSDGHRGWVYYLAVAQDCRGQGLGKAMMAACEAWLKARGVPKLHLLVRRDNAGVIEFYDRLGYEVSDSLMLMRWLK
ncbi:GNAT family acetyltransferase [Blastochloris tepida]|jgi:ribosomal protein S18 acetylase RimI-like enzyme|uniref:GNAT family acetyltransferase n=1 Tax=Blastochloris tepida TaxID=2233851 RepID=A0A348G2P3_9HYPH|nr:GNAT family acetyltransferase [Blastochloris tepida]BBF93826.1 GNAT family acetyltransferase [Blastochloris tepida]